MTHRLKCRCTDCIKIIRSGPKPYGSPDLTRKAIHLLETEKILVGYKGEYPSRKEYDLAEKYGYHPVKEIAIYGNPTGANIPDGRVINTDATARVSKSQRRNKNNWK